MNKSNWIIFAALLIVIAGYLGYRSYIRSQREHHIFCESLVKGMNPEQVLASLKTFGEIQYNKTDVDPSRYDQIAVGYSDSQIVGRRVYLLSFEDGQYFGVGAIAGFETVNYFCE